MFNKKLVAAIFIFSFSSSAFASGGSSFRYEEPVKRVDHAYENGKAIYNGRINGEVVSYCIADTKKGKASVAIKRNTIKQLKGANYAEVGERLHNCTNPKETMNSLLNKHQLSSVTYYLNKRYRLRLARS